DAPFHALLGQRNRRGGPRLRQDPTRLRGGQPLRRAGGGGRGRRLPADGGGGRHAPARLPRGGRSMRSPKGAGETRARPGMEGLRVPPGGRPRAPPFRSGGARGGRGRPEVRRWQERVSKVLRAGGAGPADHARGARALPGIVRRARRPARGGAPDGPSAPGPSAPGPSATAGTRRPLHPRGGARDLRPRDRLHAPERHVGPARHRSDPRPPGRPRLLRDAGPEPGRARLRRGHNRGRRALLAVTAPPGSRQPSGAGVHRARRARELRPPVLQDGPPPPVRVPRQAQVPGPRRPEGAPRLLPVAAPRLGPRSPGRGGRLGGACHRAGHGAEASRKGGRNGRGRQGRAARDAAPRRPPRRGHEHALLQGPQGAGLLGPGRRQPRDGLGRRAAGRGPREARAPRGRAPRPRRQGTPRRRARGRRGGVRRPLVHDRRGEKAHRGQDHPRARGDPLPRDRQRGRFLRLPPGHLPPLPGVRLRPRPELGKILCDQRQPRRDVRPRAHPVQGLAQDGTETTQRRARSPREQSERV
ncbi:MAG: hypothetical protein AVDCRST_MAG12-2905, partial [uncultured Rubrobacteraceae bacterium]